MKKENLEKCDENNSSNFVFDGDRYPHCDILVYVNIFEKNLIKKQINSKPCGLSGSDFPSRLNKCGAFGTDFSSRLRTFISAMNKLNYSAVCGCVDGISQNNYSFTKIQFQQNNKTASANPLLEVKARCTAFSMTTSPDNACHKR